MPQKIELDEIAKTNPQIDLAKLREGIELNEKLKTIGLPARGYEIAPPFARKRAEVVEPSEDLQMVNLRNS